jgi:16S rRNA (uracil1498-N3)-methyltransferase
MSNKSFLTAPRFLVPGLGNAGDEAVLPPEESHHLARVLRLGRGDRVVVFDGQGREFGAEILRADRLRASVRLVDGIQAAPESSVPFAVVPAVLKGTAMDDVIRDSTMVGAKAIEPVISSRVVVRGLFAKPAMVERWRRVALASAKQSRRAVVPDVEPPRVFKEWIADRKHELALLFVEPTAQCETRSLRSFIGGPAPASAALIVGPEGGWHTDEIATAVQGGCIPVTLGGLTLRANAVPLAAASVFRFLWSD